MGLGEIMRPMRTWRGPHYRGEGIVGNTIARRYSDVDGKVRIENQRPEALIPEGVVELRVHGVNGGTPEQNLHDSGPVQVSGDDTAGFYRRRSELNSGPERTVEAYNWSSINSKKSIRSWWLILFPFAAANFAGWLLPKEMAERPKRRIAAQVIVRLIGLSVTLLAVQGAALVFVDLIGVQCGAMEGCKTDFTWGWVGSIAGWGIIDDQPVRLAMMYSLLPAFGILALWLLGRRGRAYEAYGAGTPNPELEGWDKPIGDVIDEVRMDRVEFWQAPDVVYVQAWLHATAGLAALTAVMAFAARELQDKAQHHESLYLLGVLAMVLLGLSVLATGAVSKMHQIPRLWLRKRNLAFYLPRWSWVPAGLAIALYGLTFWAGWLSVGGTGQDQAPLEAIRNALIWTTVPAVGLVFGLAALVGAKRSAIFVLVSGPALFYFLAETNDGMQFTWLTGNQWFGIELAAAVILTLAYRYRSAPFEKWPEATDHSSNPTWNFGTTSLIIVAGAALLLEVFNAFALTKMRFSPFALREGVLLDRLGGNASAGLERLHDLRGSNVAKLARDLDPAFHHAEHAAKLALDIFDQTVELHGLTGDDRELLHAGAMLHNIGLFINHAAHHKHSYYIVRNTEQLTGFTDREIELVAQITRYHRKSHPKPSHAEFSSLGSQDKDRVRTLAGILRIAIGLDRSHAGTVTSVNVSYTDDLVRIEPVAAPDGDIELELFAANERSGLLSLSLKRTVKVELS